MTPSKHISRDRLNRKLCIDCKYYHKEACYYFRSDVNNGPKYQCSHCRENWYLCTYKGNHFALLDDVVVHETEDLAKKAKEIDFVLEMNSRSFWQKVGDYIAFGWKFKY